MLNMNPLRLDPRTFKTGTLCPFYMIRTVPPSVLAHWEGCNPLFVHSTKRGCLKAYESFKMGVLPSAKCPF